jgi:hypothetical protein
MEGSIIDEPIIEELEVPSKKEIQTMSESQPLIQEVS